MNKAALANFLRHLLFLLVILEFVSGIIIVFQTSTCWEVFFNERLVPPHLDPNISRAIFLSVDLQFRFFTCIGYLVLIISAVGFVGAICLQSHQLINFSAGMAFLFMAPIEITSGQLLGNMIRTLDEWIYTTMSELFESSNSFEQEVNRWQPSVILELFKLPYDKDGWNIAVTGGPDNHTDIDLIQTGLRCCGLTGRFFWKVPVPRTCCSQRRFPGENCTAMVAYTKYCSQDYSRFKDGVIALQFQSFLFCLLSLLTAAISLYLARLRIKFPDGKYRSEHSSSEEEETSFFS